MKLSLPLWRISNMDKSDFKFSKKTLIYTFIQMVRDNSFSIFIEAHKSKISLKTMNEGFYLWK